MNSRNFQLYAMDVTSHAPWSITREKKRWMFSTEEEAEYPDKLCLKIAELVLEYATCLSPRSPRNQQYLRESLGRQGVNPVA